MGTCREFPNMRLNFLKTHPRLDVLAAVGFRSCVILSASLEIVQKHLDADRDEIFYCCEFVDIDENTRAVSKPGAGNGSLHAAKNLLCVAGERGIIKILDLNGGRLDGHLKGHTGAIYDLKCVGNIIISCSEDSTIRLWNVHNYECVGVVGGIFGHRDHVLSVDVNHQRRLMVSTGTDATIKQWELDFDALCTGETPGHVFLQVPLQNFTNVHKSAITGVKYYGDLILSLCNNTISAVYNNSDLSKLINGNQNFGLKKESPVFIGSISFYGDCKRFSVLDHVLIGISTAGDIYLFDLQNLSVEKTPYIIETRLGKAEDFVVIGDHIYITTGGSIHRLAVDILRFDGSGEPGPCPTQ